MSDLKTAALALAQRGFRVHPCKPDKTPYTKWQDQASTDPDVIGQWWTQWPDALIGAVVPRGHIVVDLDADGDHGGQLSDLPELVPTLTTATRGLDEPSRHFWFKLPDGCVPSDGTFKKNLIARHGRDKAGWDLRYDGRHYVIVPPSVRPNGLAYVWVDQDVKPVVLPAALALLIVEPPKPAAQARANTTGDRPIDTFNADKRWADVLGGWTLHSGDGDSDGSLWRHPTATADYSASVKGGRLYCWSGNAGLPVAGPHDGGLSRFDAMAHLEHGGDVSRAVRAIGGAPSPGQTKPATARPTADTGIRIIDDTWDCGAGTYKPGLPSRRWLQETNQRLVFWRESFYRWSKGQWKPWEDAQFTGILFRDFEYAQYMVSDGAGGWKAKGFDPSAAKIKEIKATLASLTVRENSRRADNALVFANGVLDLATGKLGKYDPAIFNLHKIQATYDRDATCPGWLSFLESSLPEIEQRQLLQEMFGYLLSGRQDKQKIFGLIGRPRSGKSTIMKVLAALVGGEGTEASLQAISLPALADRFGLQSLLDASIIQVNEARFERDTKAARDVLLQISGCDPVQVEIKFKSAVSTVLPGRVVMVSNELPNVREESGAFASRFIHITFGQTFMGREDFGLLDRLLGELSGITLWAMEGLKRLDAQGKFTATSHAVRADRTLRLNTNHISVWFAEQCILDAVAVESFSDLRDSYATWCDDNDVEENYRATDTRLGRFLSGESIVSAKERLHGVSTRRRLGVRLRRDGYAAPSVQTSMATPVPVPAVQETMGAGGNGGGTAPVALGPLCARSGCDVRLKQMEATLHTECYAHRSGG